MSLIVAWIAFPLVLAAIGAGWGAVVERAAGAPVNDALLLPLGLATALVVAGTITTFAATAPAAVPVVAVGAAVGLVLVWPGRRRLIHWGMLAALGVLLVYGAPVLLSGQATFAGFVKLDDTATWFNVIDHVMSHARSVSGETPSTYTLVYTGDVGATYPLGAFMLPGVGRALVGADIAWVFQPYLACGAAATALCVYALAEPLVASTRLRALVAFGAAQSALLYGYSLWGGIKELTAAFLLALGVALGAPMLRRRPAGWRHLLPLSVATGALIQTLSAGAGGLIVPALIVILACWWWQDRRSPAVGSRARTLAWLVALTAVFVIPVWDVVGAFFSNKGGLFSGLFSSGQSQATKLGNLLHPLSAFQLAGIWPVRDFRLTAPTTPTALLIGATVIACLAGLWLGVRRGRLDIALYVAVALVGSSVFYLGGATPWVTGKVLAICSPAVLAGGLTGAAMLWQMRTSRPAAGAAGALLACVLLGGVLWSNVLSYGDVTLAPRARLAELQHIGRLVAGKGPTFINQYEIYADRHFLRAGTPVEPAEYRIQGLPLRDGTILTKAAAADLDSFPLSTLEPFRSIVTPISPVESRPPSTYHLVWQGRYYQLWQRPARPTRTILDHVPLGESTTVPYCGQAQDGPYAPLCSIDPVSIPPCPRIRALGAVAAREHALLVAYQRPAPIVARGDQTRWPATWLHDRSEHSLTPLAPGEAVSHIAVAAAETYQLWLGGSFSRGFAVSVDGRRVGRIKDQLMGIDGYVPVADVFLTPGVHTFALTYPGADLTPGSAENELTALAAIALEPQSPASELITVAPAQAERLCERPLDWIELVS